MTTSFFGVNGNGASGPGSSTSYSGDIVLGAVFMVTASGYELTGYGFWRADSSQSASASAALWEGTALNTGTLVASSEASFSGMTAGQWNYVTLSSPIALTENQVYKVQIGLVNNFPFTLGQFGTGGAYSAGIVNGALTCFSDITANGGTNPDSYHDDQSTFTTSSSDPTSGYVTSINGSFNGWVDVTVAPASTGVTGSFGLAMAPLAQSLTGAGGVKGSFGLAMAPLAQSLTAAETISGRLATSLAPMRLALAGTETGEDVTGTLGVALAPMSMRFSQRGAAAAGYVPDAEEARELKRWLLWDL